MNRAKLPEVQKLPTVPSKNFIKVMPKEKTGVESGISQYTFKNGDEYNGNWTDFKMNGFGVLTYSHSPDHRYQGDWKDNQKHGKGKEFFADGSTFEGNFYQGKKQGHGCFQWKQNSKFTCQFD